VKQDARKPLFLIVITAYLAFTASFEGSYILAHFHHEHDHAGASGSCSVCTMVERAALLLEGFGRISAIIQTLRLVVPVRARTKRPPLPNYAALTPVTLKIRFNS
jgi:hypothetical protein